MLMQQAALGWHGCVFVIGTSYGSAAGWSLVLRDQRTKTCQSTWIKYSHLSGFFSFFFVLQDTDCFRFHLVL